MIPSHEIKSRFSKAASTYDYHAKVHKKVAKHLIEHSLLPQTSKLILELGAGTGALTSEMSIQYQQCQIICLDISKESLHVLASKLPKTHCIQADFEYLPFDEKFPLVVSSTAIQWAHDASRIREIILDTLEIKGTFAISVVVQGTFSLLLDVKKQLFPETTSKKLPCFQILKSLFSKDPFLLKYAEVKTYYDYFENIEGVFLSIKELGLGAHGGPKLTPGRLAILKNAYQTECEKIGSKPFLKYTIGFFSGTRR
jgi:malonyl-ACP O-methyltransferase BioC